MSEHVPELNTSKEKRERIVAEFLKEAFEIVGYADNFEENE